ncbi:hydrogenase 1, b-type cytochrome subunit [Rubrivivax sp. A210]|uniref:Ni/Fe-hydrogenase, b-type cytochrome subunit n=1 Tax=Rubrivivax sp. A210 TaxID=2772301 RepID=UPI00191B3452|nr:Ni/Fe-hydrogenase, b-type cytochrome subunit [Rubrivivax sp. A210]CAD5375017.1 hydrogenase 1, b-type cytochrome subunit [Rubrivivax sp. A210]
MSTPHDKLFPVYVWEAPVRIWHWVMALAFVVLGVTGYLIGSPPGSVGGEASDHFLFGYIRFTHFAAAYVFAILFAMRIVWAFIGNRFAREIFVVPLAALNGKWWHGLFDALHYYATFRGKGPVAQGHNPLAQAATFVFYVLGTAFMILSGFAMYGEAQGMESLTFKLFTSWMMPLFGYSQNMHTFHHLCMWYLITFVLVHLYMVVREDSFSKETIISSMISGWRTSRE